MTWQLDFKQLLEVFESTEAVGKTVAMSSALMILSGCGAGVSDTPSDGSHHKSDEQPMSQRQRELAASRFLGHAAWGGHAIEIQRVIELGQEAWLDQQMAMPIEQTFVDWLVQRGYGAQNAINGGEPGMMPGLWRRLMGHPDLVRQRIALALSELFVCSADKLITGVGYKQFAVAFYWDLLEKHAFGHFRQLLEAVTLSPMMGIYLNTKGNQKADASGRVPDQNYAREVMQLFTIGLVGLNGDGTEIKDALGKPVSSFNNEDVEGLSKVFTGWNFDQSVSPDSEASFWQNCQWLSRPMKLNPQLHSSQAKSFLGITIPENTNGIDSLKIALDTLFNHDNTGPFFAKQMIQRLVTSNPTPAYVQRVASVFANNGIGVRGDLKAVFKAILLDPEARRLDTGGTDNSFGKLREPMVRWIQWARTFSATSTSTQYNKEWVIANKLVHTESELGQAPMFAPSVFNYFRPGYTPPNSPIASQNLYAPEFQILTEPAIVGYVNFMQKTVNNGESLGPAVKPAGYLQADYSHYVDMAGNPMQLVDTLALHLAPHAFNTSQMQVMAQILMAIPADAQGLKKRVYTAVLMIMCVPDYLIQR